MALNRASLAAGLLLGLPLAVSAQTPSLAPEFPVNAYTTGDQARPAVASAGDGTFVVAWQDGARDGSGTGIFARRFSSPGVPAGGDLQVNTYTTGYQIAPQVGSDAAGKFVVVWQGTEYGGGRNGLFGQRFDASGAKVGSEFQVNASMPDAPSDPALAVGPAGDFVAVWSMNDNGVDVFGQRFNAAGAKVGPEFRVNTYTTGTQSQVRVARDPSGGFVAVWTSSEEDGSSTGVFGQRFDAAGTKTGDAFRINAYTTGSQDAPSVVVDRGGNFVVVWRDSGEFESAGIVARRFDASGAPVGGDFPVNSYTTGNQFGSSVVLDGAGDFVVTWVSYGEDGSNYGVFAKRFDRSGAPVTVEFQVNQTTAGTQNGAAAAAAGRGFVIAWGSGYNGAETGVFARGLALEPEGAAVDVHGIGTSDLNGVLEPGDAALVEPRWLNVGPDLDPLDGAASNLSGPVGPPYLLLDPLAAYGPVPHGATTNCQDGNPNPCYAVQIGGPRPAVHWDATLLEDLSAGGTQVWTLHLGDSFSDVPRSQPFYAKIETLLHHGITSGCTAAAYCPAVVVSRDQMAIFLAKGIAGLGELVPTSGVLAGHPYDCSSGGVSRFSDVAPTDLFCRHVHYLAAQNVTLGCSATKYCPTEAVTRDAMASFLAKAIVAPAGAAAVPASYGPDPGTGRSYSCVLGAPNVHFTDVPASNAFCKHIHFLWAKGIVSGCSATQYCTAAPVARDAMAKFIANGFGLQLYGP
jgi:hypothetical protein